jgi:hypothetical protein
MDRSLRMKIQICGSMSFAKEMKKIQEKLMKQGHSVLVPQDTELHLSNPSFIDNLSENLEHCISENVLKVGFDLIAKADAILVLNFPKNGIKGYIGTSTLMELGVAHFLGKKIFILNDVPDFNKVRWAHEVTMMQPVFLKGDLAKIH